MYFNQESHEVYSTTVNLRFCLINLYNSDSNYLPIYKCKETQNLVFDL